MHCASYYGLSPLNYEVNLTTSNSVKTSCDQEVCMIIFGNLTGISEGIAPSIRSENNFGYSDLIIYPNIIGKSFNAWLRCVFN